MTPVPVPIGATVGELCERSRPELECLGTLAAPLLVVLSSVEAIAGDRPADALDDPSLALDVLLAAPDDPAVVGRLLEFLRLRSGSPPSAVLPSSSSAGRLRRAVTVTDAVDAYRSGALALMAEGTQHTYRTWSRRLVEAHGDDDIGGLTAGDLKDLIAHHVLDGRNPTDRRRTGRAAEENAITTYRHLWAYLVEKGWASDNVALRLRKPARGEPRRRPIRPDEARLLRHLAAATGSDPLLDEVTLTIPERLGLRRIELCRLRLCDVDLDARTVEVWGKGDKLRRMPIPPELATLLARYVESRRPADLSPATWHRSTELFLRRPPTPAHPLGRPTGRRRIEELFERLRSAAPDLFSDGDLTLHSYRHALGTYVDHHHGRAVTRAVLGHTSRRTPTDHYVHVTPDQVANAVTEYERHVTLSRSTPKALA